jgi:hypothetical protein
VDEGWQGVVSGKKDRIIATSGWNILRVLLPLLDVAKNHIRHPGSPRRGEDDDG